MRASVFTTDAATAVSNVVNWRTPTNPAGSGMSNGGACSGRARSITPKSYSDVVSVTQRQRFTGKDIYRSGTLSCVGVSPWICPQYAFRKELAELHFRSKKGTAKRPIGDGTANLLFVISLDEEAASELRRKVKLNFAIDQFEPSVKRLAGFRSKAL